ncbi:dynein axonemal intermediate chain 3-like [Atheta coriaria]|uniref:dynein axonemal intermediate chain 3-like n=1 Tax=Dalotia coriaria TaxID=877792 RepID=UPI0031F44425
MLTNKMESETNIPGVILLRDLSLEVRKRLGLDAVTIRHPYTRVQRGLLIREELIERIKPQGQQTIREIDEHTDEDQFADEDEVDEANDETLLLMVRTPTHDDCFQLCIMPQAEQETIRSLKRLETRVTSQIIRHPRHRWQADPATEEYINAEKPSLFRGLAKVEMETIYPRYKTIELRLCPAREVSKNGCYTELVTTEKYRKAIVHQRRVSVYVQAKPYTNEAGTQTPLKYPKTTWTQYEFAYPEIAAPDEEFAIYFSDKLRKKIRVLEEAFLHNSHINFYSLDYYSGVIPYRPAIPLEYNLKIVLKDVLRCKDKMVNSIVEMANGYMAVSYSDQSWRASKRQRVKQCAVDFNVVLVWSTEDPLQPKILMDTLGHNVTSLKFKNGFLLGGCSNGQVLMWTCNVDNNDNTDNEHYQFVCGLLNWSWDIVNLRVEKPIAMSYIEDSHLHGIGAIEWLNHQVFGRFPPLCLQFYTVGIDGVLKLWNCPLDLVKPCIGKSKWKSSKWDVIRNRILPKTDHVADNSALFQLKPYFEIKLTEKPVSNAYFYTDSEIQITLGTYLGELLFFKWNTSINNFEEYLYDAVQHHGPIVRIEKHPEFDDILLSVGGRAFSIWLRANLVLARSCSSPGVKYTDGRWIHSAGGVCLSRNDGYLEFWDFSTQSNTYLEKICISSEEILEFTFDKLNLITVILSDTSGSIFYIEILNYCAKDTAEDTESTRKIFENSAECYSSWINWTNKRNEKKKSAELKLLEEQKLAQLRKVRRSQRAPEHKTIITVKPRPTFNQLETQYAIDTVLNQKNLSLDEALRLQVPIQMARAEEVRLLRKQRGITSRAMTIFAANLSTYLPQFVSANEDKHALPALAPPLSAGEQTELKHTAVNLQFEADGEQQEALHEQQQHVVAEYELILAELKAFITKNRFRIQQAERQPFVLRHALGEKRRQFWAPKERRRSRKDL